MELHLISLSLINDFINSFPPGKLFMLFCYLLIFFQIDFFEKFFQEYHLSDRQIGSRSGPAFCWACSGSNLFTKVIYQQTTLGGKELKIPNVYLIFNQFDEKYSFI